MKNLLVRGNGYRLGGINHPINIRLGHFPVPDRDDAVGVQALDMTTRDARIHRMDTATGHQLRLFHRPLDGLYRGLNIDHHATLEPPGGMRANTHHFDGPVELALADNGHHLGGANIQSDNHVFRINR